MRKGLQNLVVLSHRFGLYYASKRINQFLETNVLASLNKQGLDDIFCGALAAALGSGKAEWDAVKFAASTIAYAVVHSENRLEAPTYASVNAHIAQTNW